MISNDVTAKNPDNILQEELPTKPNILLRVIRGNHEAEMMLQRTGSNTSDPLMEDIRAVLAENAIVKGIKEGLLADLCAAPVYNKNYVVAVGHKPTVGEDGRVEYRIKTSRSLRPTIREDGTADYKDLGFIVNVEAGQVLADIIPPGRGEDGFDILGNVLEGLLGKEAPSPKGPGTEISEDGLHLVAAVAGNALVNKGVVSIQEVLKIKGNVDNSTGDITFSGDVLISGDIASGFRVESKEGSINVKGIVEGAHLLAKGDITIAEGINGMNRGTLTAMGNIKARYLQNCTIRAEGSVFADTIMYCNLECDGDVELNGKRAVLIGGSSSIAGKLVAKMIGTESHTSTVINMVSTGMAVKREMAEMSARITAIDGEIQKIMQILTRFDDLQKQNRLTPEHAATIQTVKESYVKLNSERQQVAATLEKTKQEQLEAAGKNSWIECKGRVHTGVKITFGPLTYNVQDSFVNSRIGADKGDIYISNL